MDIKATKEIVIHATNLDIDICFIKCLKLKHSGHLQLNLDIFYETQLKTRSC